jgi:polysaccharide export outer membrane protein
MNRNIKSLSESGPLVVAALAAVFILNGCETPTQSGPPLPDQPMVNTTARLSPGDVIKLSFSGSPELNQTEKIQVDGKISLPLVGQVTAAGKTVPALQSELVGLYKAQLRNSELTVTLESGVANVVVSGYVNRPGKLQFDRPTTVFQAVMEAGGASEYGNLGKVHLVRTVNGRQHTQILDLKAAMSGQTAQVYYVKDGDVIYVAQRIF